MHMLSFRTATPHHPIKWNVFSVRLVCVLTFDKYLLSALTFSIRDVPISGSLRYLLRGGGEADAL